jgi:hypothetical protein
MPHINNLGAAIYSDLSVATGTVSSTTYLGAATALASPSESAFVALFATENLGTAGASGSFHRIKNVRTFPEIGTPANIVNVPEFGTKQAKTIQGQADAPSLQVTINFIPVDWAKGATVAQALGNMVGDGILRAWRFSLLTAEPAGFGSVAGELGTVGNSEYYWNGKLEAMLVKPDLKDSMTAVLTLSIQSDFYGAYTV